MDETEGISMSVHKCVIAERGSEGHRESQLVFFLKLFGQPLSFFALCSPLLLLLCKSLQGMCLLPCVV